jgi:ElaB/YqjD/DUF883 family membrane-anchored ribosome-binding protein
MATTTPTNDPATRASMQDAYTHMKEAGNSVRDAARTAGADAQNAARTQYTKGRQSAETMALQAEERIKERPLAAIGVAFAAGWLISRMMR